MEIVKGYMVRTTEIGNKEQLFAVNEKGEIKTCVRKYSTTFNEKGVEWIETNELPKDAEFIGRYKMKF